MSSEPTLAYTVHHQGRRYIAGTTAEEIGPAAGELGAHVWEGGKAPTKAQTPSEDTPAGGTQAHTPPVPTPSALIGGRDVPEVTTSGDGNADTAEATARRAGRRGGSGS
jgi:hypothetical protein